VVLPRHRAVIFIHGCFWHRHEGCRYATTPAANAEFWARKLAANAERDARHCANLLNTGWRVAMIWECGVRIAPDKACEQCSRWLLSDRKVLIWPRQRAKLPSPSLRRRKERLNAPRA
jgi:DNA mismatch endonuclease (patch repair protein)